MQITANEEVWLKRFRLITSFTMHVGIFFPIKKWILALIHFQPMIHFYTPRKGGMEVEQLLKMG